VQATAHCPLWQAGAPLLGAAQPIVQSPQFCGSAFTSTQTPPQFFFCEAQSLVHTPSEHT
jgi:hypothetical protein